MYFFCQACIGYVGPSKDRYIPIKGELDTDLSEQSPSVIKWNLCGGRASNMQADIQPANDIIPKITLFT